MFIVLGKLTHESDNILLQGRPIKQLLQSLNCGFHSLWDKGVGSPSTEWRQALGRVQQEVLHIFLLLVMSQQLVVVLSILCLVLEEAQEFQTREDDNEKAKGSSWLA